MNRGRRGGCARQHSSVFHPTSKRVRGMTSQRRTHDAVSARDRLKGFFARSRQVAGRLRCPRPDSYRHFRADYTPNCPGHPTGDEVREVIGSEPARGIELAGGALIPCVDPIWISPNTVDGSSHVGNRGRLLPLVVGGAGSVPTSWRSRHLRNVLQSFGPHSDRLRNLKYPDLLAERFEMTKFEEHPSANVLKTSARPSTHIAEISIWE